MISVPSSFATHTLGASMRPSSFHCRTEAADAGASGHGRPVVPPPVGGSSNAAAAGSLADELTDELLARDGEVPIRDELTGVTERGRSPSSDRRQYPGYPGQLGNRGSSSVCGGADNSSRYLGDLGSGGVRAAPDFA